MIERIRREPIRSRLVLLAVVVLIPLWTYAGSASFYRETVEGGGVANDLHAYMYHHAGCFLILGLGSLVLGRVLGWSPPDLGWGPGDWREGLIWVGVLVPAVVVPVTYLSSFQEPFIQEYPVADSALRNGSRFLLHASVYLLYYLGWEAFFRGFLLFGLLENMGRWNAILVQTIPSTLIHTGIFATGKPFTETIGAIPFGIFAGWLAVRTESFWYVFLIHAALGLLLDFWMFV